jgi:hypothetical protein
MNAYPLFAQAPDAAGLSQSTQTGLMVGGLVVGLVVSLIVAVQAQRRGYPLLVWLIAGVLGNAIFFLVMLGVMPDFARRKQRQTELADLDARLEKATQALAEAPATLPVIALPPLGERSLGDQSTHAPERSLGDEETRL